MEAHAQRPSPRRTLGVSLGVLVLGAGLLLLALADRPGSPPAPPAIPAAAAASQPAPALVPTPVLAAPIVAARPRSEQAADLAAFRRQVTSHVPARWEAGFYPLYDIAARTYGLNWLLLASIHRQETSFSTESDTYHGLNFAGCCGGPMQFNVRNGPPTTWDQVGQAYRDAARPPGYNHPTAHHPSVYDDFDAMMAAGRLLAADGATRALDGGAWQAAYGYYGHDETGVTYADQVVARAISWSQGGFCINCPLDQAMVDAVDAAYGAPVLAELRAAAKQAAKQKRAGAHARHTSSHHG